MNDHMTRLAWTKLHGLAFSIAKRGVAYEDGSMSPDWHDRVADVLAHAWIRFVKIRKTRPEFTRKSALRCAVRTAISRVRRGDRFVQTRRRKQIDALDARACDRSAQPDVMAQPAGGYRDPSDRTNAEQLIDLLPIDLAPVARLLSYGLSAAQVAERRGVSRTTIYRAIESIKHHMANILPEPKDNDDCWDEPKARIRPIATRDVAIPARTERNRCRRSDVLVTPCPFTGDIVLNDRSKMSTIQYRHDSLAQYAIDAKAIGNW